MYACMHVCISLVPYKTNPSLFHTLPLPYAPSSTPLPLPNPSLFHTLPLPYAPSSIPSLIHPFPLPYSPSSIPSLFHLPFLFLSLFSAQSHNYAELVISIVLTVKLIRLFVLCIKTAVNSNALQFANASAITQRV